MSYESKSKLSGDAVDFEVCCSLLVGEPDKPNVDFEGHAQVHNRCPMDSVHPQRDNEAKKRLVTTHTERQQLETGDGM